MQRVTAGAGRLLLLLLTLGALALVLVFRVRGEGSPAVDRPPRLIEGVTGSVDRIDPLSASQSPAERSLSALIFAGLTRPDATGAPRPALAEGWVVEAEGRTFTFTLRSGLSWHDGRPVTSADVLFTVQALLARREDSDPALVDVWSQARLTGLGESVVRVTLPAPFAPLPAYAAFGLLPSHLLSGVPPAEWERLPYFRAPVGAGPFQLRRLTETVAELDAFPAYALGAPYLPGIDLRLFPSAERLSAERANGGVHAALLHPAERVSGSHTLASFAYRVVLLNNADPLLADARVRLALSLALDRAALAAPSGGVPVDVPFPPQSWAAPPDAVAAQDTGAAATWLTEAGYRRDGEALRTAAGQSLTLSLLAPAEGDAPDLAARIAGMWRAMGVAVTVEVLPTAELVRDRLAPGRFQSAVVGWDPGPDPDPFPAWHSSRQGAADGNVGRVSDAELDRLAVAGRAALTLTARAQAYVEFARRLRLYAPGIVLFVEARSYAVPDWLAMPARVAAGDADRFGQVHLWQRQ